MKLMIKMGFFCSDFLINCKNHNKKCLIIVVCFMALNILTCLSNKTLKQTRLKAISSKRLGFVFITDGKMIRMLSHNEACTLLSVIYSSGQHFKQCGKSPTSEGNQQLQAVPRFETICLTCQDVFKGPNIPPVPTLSPVSRTTWLLLLFLYVCPSTALVSLSFLLSWTWKYRLTHTDTNNIRDTFSSLTAKQKCHGYQGSCQKTLLLLLKIARLHEVIRFVWTYLGAWHLCWQGCANPHSHLYVDLVWMSQQRQYFCLLPLSESSLLLGCLLLFIVTCLRSSGIRALHKQEMRWRYRTGGWKGTR